MTPNEPGISTPPAPMKTNEKEEPWMVIGVIDSYGAIHLKKHFMGDTLDHSALWPTAQKRFRFVIKDWDLLRSPLSKESISPEEAEDVIAAIRKILTPPEWVLRGEAWEAAGRPHGKAGDRFDRDYEKQKQKKARTK